MQESFRRAIANITKHGDTDIFPLSFENHILFDKWTDAIALLKDLDTRFADSIARYPPSNHSALAPAGYTGFRWATQLDPLWNAYLLGLVISIAEHIEAARIPASQNVVFSYRYSWDDVSGDLFDRNYNWRALHGSLHTEGSGGVARCNL
jgi:hypothetical protein